jgi:uncharacterized protein YoxC
MNAYFFNITPEERVSILDKHKHIYNGYQALQPNVPNPQPLYVQDYANDKEGITINNKGEVMTYRNHNINESVKEGNMCECGGMVYEGECMECGEAYKKYDVDLYDVEDLNPKNKFDYVEGEMDEVRVADLDPEKSYKMKFPTFKDPSEMDFEEKEVKYKGMVKYQDGKPMYQFTSKDNISGAMLSPKDDDDEIEDVYDEEINEYALNYDYKEPAYQFSSKGPVDAWDDDDKNYFEDSIDVFDDEELQAGRAFADMGDKDEWSDEKILMNIRKGPKKSMGTDTKFDMDLSKVKEPFDFASGGPGRSIGVYEEDMEESELEEKWKDDAKVRKTGEYAGKTLEELQKELASLKEKSKKYQDKDEDVPQDIIRKEAQVKFAIRAKRNWPKGHMDEKKIEEELDEDVRESFVKQKNKITEMFNRIKKF